MYENIFNFMSSQSTQNGLLLVDPSTGCGKTFQSCQAIYDYTHGDHVAKKIYFTTTLLKNLPEVELREAYRRNKNPNYEKEVFVIKSNEDFVKTNLPNVQVPEKYKNSEYEKLLELIEIVKGGGFVKSPALFKDEIQKRLTNAERNFRKYLRKIISEEIKGSVDVKKDTIKKDKRYKWIGDIYPTVFTDDYKIYLLSVSKILYHNDTLIKPSYPFISAECLKNAIVFIDEFDATKETIQNYIIEKAVSTQNDYLDIVKELHSKLHDYTPAKDFYEPYREYAKGKPYLQTLESLQKEVDLLYEKYALAFNYKTSGKSIDRSRGFLFFDGSFRSYLKDNRHYIRTVVDYDNQQTKIFFETKEEYDRNKNLVSDINIYSLLRDVTNFLNAFARFVANWADRYVIAENAKRKENNEFPEIFTVENAVSTICGNYFKNDHLHTVLHDLVMSSALRNISTNESTIDDISFFNRGFKFFEFIDSEKHNEETKINFIQMNDTPEKILLFMAKNCKIVGLSATAKVKSILSNYSIVYLKDELKESFVDFSDSAYSRLVAELKNRFTAYEKEIVKAIVQSVDKNKENKSLHDRIKDVTADSDLTKTFQGMLEQLDLPDGKNKRYYQNRYCNVFEVLKQFIETEEMKSFLCLNMALPKEKDSLFDLNVFNNFVEQYCIAHEKESPEIYVLKSEEFEAEKNSVLEKLAAGKKVFVFSSYKTVGAGQNLQYNIPNGEKTIQIFSRNGEKEEQKDFDAIYLGDVTNVITDISRGKKVGLKELLQFLFEIKYLYENNEISPKDLRSLVQQGFKAYSNSYEYSYSLESVRKSASARRKITRDVIQAVGRLCRTTNKKENIYIFTNNALLSSLDTHCVNCELMTPELKKLFNYAENYVTPLPEEKVIVENEACRKSENANSYIKGMLQRTWTDFTMRLWKELRECVLKYPTASMAIGDSIAAIKKFYIQNVENRSCYWFAQKGDFNDVKINLYKDLSAFEKELDSDYQSPICVSEDSCRLQKFFMYEGLKNHFIKNDFAVQFGNEDLILSPTLFNNIYKGALGEVAGKFILEKELKTTLKDILNPEHFEFFDFALCDGVYIDFKHWKRTLSVGKDALYKHIQEKLQKIGGKKAYIINILKEDNFEIVRTENVIEIPYLIDEKGQANKDAIKLLIGEMHDAK